MKPRFLEVRTMMTKNSPRKSRATAVVAVAPAAELLTMNMTTSVDVSGDIDAELAELHAMIDDMVVDAAPVESDDEVIVDRSDEEVVDVVAVEVPTAAIMMLPAPVVVVRSAEDKALDDLIASLGAPPVVTVQMISDADIAAALDSVEANEIAMGSASPHGVSDGGTPTGEASDVTDDEVAAEGKVAKVKKVVVPRVFYGKNKVGRIKDKLGESVGDYTVLTLADAGLDEDALKEKVAETFELIAKMAIKKANRATMLIEFVAGKKSTLNEVGSHVLKVLARDGYVSTGLKGNMMDALLGATYSIASARAMGGNTVGAYEDLKLFSADGKGRFVGNPDSILLMRVNSMLGLELKDAPVEAAV
jgi:hypothetical protein